MAKAPPRGSERRKGTVVTVVHAMLGNAAVAVVLALLALGLGYAVRSPTARHVAWVLVLVKLVTPPLFTLPLPVLPASWGSWIPESKPTAAPVVQLASTAPGINELPAEEVERPASWWSQIWSGGIVDWALAVWLAGAVGWFAWQGRRIVRFGRRVARAEDAGPDVAAAVQRIASA